MSFVHRTVLAIVAAIPLLAEAQGADPANPAAIVAASRYDSAFKTYQPFTETGEAPDQGWRAANEQMARLQGHAGHVIEAGARDTLPSASSPLPTKVPESQASPSAHGKHHSHGGK